MKDFTGATFCFIGRPGCGKGTQTKLLKDFLEKNGYKDIVSFSVGELFRRLQEEDTVMGRWTKDILSVGALPPDWIAIALWVEELRKKLVNNNQTVLIDGSPRRVSEAEAIDDLLERLKRPPAIAIVLEISAEETIRRSLKRERKDDITPAIKKRLEWYETNVVPVLNYWENKLIKVDGIGTIEDVQKRIIEALND